MKADLDQDKVILLYDGLCNICNSLVQFLIKKDHLDKFRFAQLQSDFAKKYVSTNDFDHDSFNTVLFIQNGVTYRKSTAAIKSLNALGGFWNIFKLLLIIPAFLRDPIYMLISNTRYSLFGKKDACEIPDASIRHKFIS